nr:GNAT family N-acetyltransferase [Spirochaeta lutea]
MRYVDKKKSALKEPWDLYTKNRERTGEICFRGEPLPKERFHLGVMAIIINDQNEMLLTKRHPQKKLGNLWECTAGSVLSGETSSQGMQREIKEEIGLEVDCEDGAFVYSFLEEDCIWDIWRFKISSKTTDLILQDSEVIDAQFFCWEEINRLINRNETVPTLKVLIDLNETNRLFPPNFENLKENLHQLPLYSANLFIDAIQENEIAVWHQKMLDPQNRAEYSNNSVPELSILEKIHSDCMFLNDSKGSHYFIYCYPRQLLGVLTATKIAEAEYEIGFRIFSQLDRSKGYMSEILPTFIEFLYKSRSPQKLIARSDKRNKSAERLLLKSGFKISGENLLNINGNSTEVNEFTRQF